MLPNITIKGVAKNILKYYKEWPQRVKAIVLLQLADHRSDMSRQASRNKVNCTQSTVPSPQYFQVRESTHNNSETPGQSPSADSGLFLWAQFSWAGCKGTPGFTRLQGKASPCEITYGQPP